LAGTRTIRIGGFAHLETVTLGGGHPVLVQTMWKDRLSSSCLDGEAGSALVRRIEGLWRLGCRLLRFAVPDREAAELLGKLAGMVSMPLSADIHFDYKLALRCLDFPIAKIRINPGNIGGANRIRAVLSKAKDKGVPIRIGVNGGSLPRDLGEQADAGKLSRGEALVLAAEREFALFDEFQFTDFLVSLKASSVADTIKANRLLASRSGVPLHLGVTEAGPLVSGVVRNTAALYTLLKEGIGDTLRVSLSDTMEQEVIAGREILRTIDEESGSARGITLVSCPRCGRNSFDTHGFTGRWRDYLYGLDKTAVIAVMGCAVNGPGESRHADLGITGAGDKVLIFRHGNIVRTIDAKDADSAFREELDKL
jgi:(E)-4-hydroxy-3-methylbut-2-enyl-diphosphate synthase